MSGIAHIEIRPATVNDARGIVDVARIVFAPTFLRMVVYGCDGIVDYIRDQVDAAGVGGDTTYTVGIVGARVVAYTEMHLAPDGLHLSYIAVHPEFQAKKIGTCLLREAILCTRAPSQRSFHLHVLEHNTSARRWYEGLGLRYGEVTQWWDMPLPRPACRPSAFVIGFPQAQACQRRFGFSQFTVLTTRGEYTVGRLGTGWFRVTDVEALHDSEFVETIARLDPRRRILAIIHEGVLLPHIFEAPQEMAKTRKMDADIDWVLTRLK